MNTVKSNLITNGSQIIRKFKTTKIFLFFALGLIGSVKAQAGNPGNSLKCMALNIYHEARGESQLGQIAVGMVTLNRAQSRFFQPTVCGVVYARHQFSWTFDRNTDVPRPGQAWNLANQIAQNVLSRSVADPTSHASHYFNPSQVNPPWARKMTFTRKIGHHAFYRMSGFGKGSAAPLSSILDTELENDILAEELNDPEVFYQVGEWDGMGFHLDDGYQEFLDFVNQLPDADGVNSTPFIESLGE